MNKLIIALSFIALALLYSCNGNESVKTVHIEKYDSFHIIGKLTGEDTGIIFIHFLQKGVKDSSKLDHGYFTFKGKSDTAEACFLVFENRYKEFFLENGKLSILFKKDSLDKALISGTPLQDEFTNYQQSVENQLGPRWALLDKSYETAKKSENLNAMDSLSKIYDNLNKEEKSIAVAYIKSHPGSSVSVYLLHRNFSYNPDPDQLDSLYNNLTPSMQASFYGKAIFKNISISKLTRIGNHAPDFSSNDVKGQAIKLNSFKGKYLMIDFWASWCNPCRQETPYLIKAYQKFHDKGFEILSVSLDDSKEKWLEAIQKDKMNWIHVSDLKGGKNDVSQLYGVRLIPMYYLLDKNGIIIAKGFNGDELEGKLTEVLH